MMISDKQLMAALKTNVNRTAALDRAEEIKSLRGASDNVAKALQTDDLSLSSQAREVMKVRRALDNMPPVRQDKLAEIKEQVQSGTYEVSSGDLAEKILGRAVVNRLLSDG